MFTAFYEVTLNVIKELVSEKVTCTSVQNKHHFEHLLLYCSIASFLIRRYVRVLFIFRVIFMFVFGEINENK